MNIDWVVVYVCIILVQGVLTHYTCTLCGLLFTCYVDDALTPIEFWKNCLINHCTLFCTVSEVDIGSEFLVAMVGPRVYVVDSQR